MKLNSCMSANMYVLSAYLSVLYIWMQLWQTSCRFLTALAMARRLGTDISLMPRMRSSGCMVVALSTSVSSTIPAVCNKI